MARKEKVSNLVKKLVATYLSRIENRTSLITITRTNLSSDLKKGTIFFTVLPLKKEEEATNFLKRQRKEIRGFLKKNMNMKTIPFIDFEIDLGEKNRQRIDELLREK